MENLLFAVSVVAGFAGLIWSADKFVLGASTTARNLGVSTLLIGLTIVSFGTSAPEIFASGAAALRGVPELAVGNVLGSNVANIGLVLAITILVRPVIVQMPLVRQELPALLFVTLFALYIFQDLRLSRIDGLLLLVILAFFVWRMIVRKTREEQTDQAELEEVAEHIADLSTPRALGLVLFGLALMIVSARVLVYGATGIALALGVSDLVIGLTIVALGTSLPELAASITSVKRGHCGLALGNIIGSNILNLLLVLPVPALLAPTAMDAVVLWRDYGAMALITLVFCVFVGLGIVTGERLRRPMGAVLLLLYLSYTALLFLMRG